MGSHPSGMAQVVKDTKHIPIIDFIQSDYEKILGKKVVERLPESSKKGNLPFLFKVLSVNQALSIQAHPDKKLAEQLHAKDPKHYQDDNHKPELAIALTPFEALCGFRSSIVLPKLLKDAIEKEASINLPDKIIKDKEVLKKSFSIVMKMDDSLVSSLVKQHASDIANSQEEADRLFLRLNGVYPGDVGCFAVYFLNIVTLKVGEALLLTPNEPHAYLDGNCVECMACSNNVVRAGLTPKFKDVDTLCSCLTYSQTSFEDTMFLKGQNVENGVSLYQPPSSIPEFKVFRVSGVSSYSWKPIDTVAVALVIDGNGSSESGDLTKGDCFLIPANTSFSISNASSLCLFIATANM